MKKSLLFLLFLLPAALFAQKAIEIKLWPDGAPNDNGILQEDLTEGIRQQLIAAEKKLEQME
jgi:hypothetical protein